MSWIFVKTRSLAWSPAALTSLVAWYDADDASTLYDATSGGNLVTSHDAQVKRWEDKSGNAYHATQNDAAGPKIQTTSGTLNAKPVMKFVVAANSYLTVADAAALRTYPLSIMAVIRTSQTTQNKGVIGKWGSAGHRDWVLSHNASGTFKPSAVLRNSTDTANISAAGSATIHNGSGRLLGAVMNPPTGNLELVIDGTVKATTAATSSNGASTVSLTIGSYSSTDNTVGLTGDIAEVVIWNSASASDREKVEGYCAHKWGLTANLAANHPYKTDAPTT